MSRQSRLLAPAAPDATTRLKLYKDMGEYKKMPIYLVREYVMGKTAPHWQEVRATSEADAARKICELNLRAEGRREDVRAQVKRLGDPSQATPITLLFYSDPNAG